uniref:ATP synthase F0 subunit 8 n=1 Tax=Oxyopes hupingensis TaxID=2713554 RepID=A0A6G6D9X4_9ARAC|nr:ATP synthase F0 subunit 8 [Oxyopes hupingensis]QIE13332.1 ATP synthase F0 subunit 8 [Oxyopes hupingensis]
MPQLMPFYWKNSVFMIFMLLMVLVIFYNFKKMELMIFKEDKSNKMLLSFLW